MSAQSCSSPSCGYTIISKEPHLSHALNSSPPTTSQLLQLRHLTMAQVASAKRGGGKKKTKKHSPVKDGQTISKVYYPEGPRPYPALTSIEQGITVTLSATTFAVSTSLTVPVYFGMAFGLSSFNSYTSYTTCFDQYKIDEIEVWVESANQNNTIATCRLATAVDLDNSAAPSSYGDVTDFQGALISNCMGGHYHRFVPHLAIAEYAGAFTSYGNIPPTWIDCASPGVEHYGLKLATDAVDGVVRNLYVNYRAKISFRASAV